MTKHMRERTLYREAYRKARIKDCFKPSTTHQAEGFIVDEAFILAAGCVEQDGIERQYHDIRIFYKKDVR